MSTPPLTIAVSKGYLMKDAIMLFNSAGYNFDEGFVESRKLYVEDKTNNIRFLEIRPWDVPTYVEQGAAHLGITGMDVLAENATNPVKLLDLKFGQCNLVLAGLANHAIQLDHNMRVATKYPKTTESYFRNRGLKVHLIKLYGAIELAPVTGLSDIISDLTATGKTLAENNLKVVETVLASSAFLIANPIAIKYRYNEINTLTETLKPHIN